MKKYETKIIWAQTNVDNFMQQLNNHGANGWYVTAYIPQPAQADMVILQRVIEDKNE